MSPLTSEEAQAIIKQAERTGGPAFPMSYDNLIAPGMSLRDYFAGQAPFGDVLQTILSQQGADCANAERIIKSCASWAYAYADAMLAERDK